MSKVYCLMSEVQMDDGMTEEGVVIEVLDGLARIRATRGTSCDGCAAGSMCKPLDGRDVIIEAKNDVGACVGERVEITVEPRAFLKASFIAYIMPLIGFFIGAAIGKFIGGKDLWAALCGLLFMVLSYGGIWRYNKKAVRAHKYQPVVIAVLSP